MMVRWARKVGAASIARQKGRASLMVDAAAERSWTIPSVHPGSGRQPLSAIAAANAFARPAMRGAGTRREESVTGRLVEQRARITPSEDPASRSCKEEEIMGMLAAVEAWGKRDHQSRVGRNGRACWIIFPNV